MSAKWSIPRVGIAFLGLTAYEATVNVNRCHAMRVYRDEQGHARALYTWAEVKEQAEVHMKDYRRGVEMFKHLNGAEEVDSGIPGKPVGCYLWVMPDGFLAAACWMDGGPTRAEAEASCRKLGEAYVTGAELPASEWFGIIPEAGAFPYPVERLKREAESQ